MAAVAGLAVAALVARTALTLPDVSALKDHNPKTTALIERRAGEAAEVGRPMRRAQSWLPLPQISELLRKAVVLSEDAAFFTHSGLDLGELKESLLRDLKERRFARGASTLTMQLARNLYLSPSKNPLRKLEEILIARKLEKALSKSRIFELYLNVIEWGDGIYGAEAAARNYFAKSAHELRPAEVALLVALIPSPRRHDPASRPPEILWRWNHVLERMRERELISQEQLDQARKDGYLLKGEQRPVAPAIPVEAPAEDDSDDPAPMESAVPVAGGSEVAPSDGQSPEATPTP